MIFLSTLAIGLPRRGKKGTTPPQPPQQGSIALTAFSRDRTIFDSGAGVGLNAADIPLSGTGTAGLAVEARAFSLDDGGATSTGWVRIATVGAGGQWSGKMAAPRSASWYQAEVRLASQPGVSAQGANRFGVGHVIAIWGQSEPNRILSGFFDRTTAPPVSDPEAVQIFFGASGSPGRHFVSSAFPLTAAASAMADTLIAARPGEKFAVAFHTVSGTDPRALVNDSDTGRNWSDDKALHDFVTADGQQVGLAAMSWFAAPGSLGSYYAEALYPLFSARTLAGAPVTFPTNINYGPGQSYHADHWFGELYDYSRTRWVAYGPHRFDIDSDMQDATHEATGALQVNLANKQEARESWRAMLALPHATMFRPLGLEPITYVNGYGVGTSGWTDNSHPGPDTPDGCQALARLTALAVLQAGGLTSWPVPEFDQCLWEPAGAWVEVWSSAGAVTTTRLKRGEPALGTQQPHWTEVMGFQINGRPALHTQIVAGRVRIFPNTGSFTAMDAIRYGEGGASGMLAYPVDAIAETWKNLPIVDLGVAGLSGVPVRPLSSVNALANTMPSSARFTTSASGPWFVDPVNVPVGTTAITFACRVRFAALPSATAMLFSQSNLGCDLELMNNGNMRATVKDGAGTRVLTAVTMTTGLTPNNWYDIVCAVDQGARTLKLTINGTLAATLPFAVPGTGEFQSNRMLSFLARNSGALQYIGEVETLEVWLSATASGAAPAGASYKRIAGPAASASADPWRQGAAAT